MNSLPVIEIPSQLFGVDLAVNHLQQRLSLASYLDSTGATKLYFEQGAILPLIERDLDTNSPRVFIGNTIEYAPAEPSDKYNAFAFFYETDPRISRSNAFWDITLNLVIWYNQEKFTRANYRIKEGFINEVYSKLFNLSTRNIDRSNIQLFKDNPFSEFTLTEQTFNHMEAPFDGFRLRFTVQGVRQNCGELWQSEQDESC